MQYMIWHASMNVFQKFTLKQRQHSTNTSLIL